MYHRILVRQQGQQKKRFISPTQIKNNQAIHGDPMGIGMSKLGSQKHIPIQNRVYSPQHQSVPMQTDIREKGRESSQQLTGNQGMVSQMRHNINEDQENQEKSSQIIPHRHKNQQSYVGNKNLSLKTKSGKKDYLMVGLSKLNQKPSGKGQDQTSNASQSRSKAVSTRKQKLKRSHADEQYSKRNVYNHKQKQVKRRPILKNSQNSSRSSSNNMFQNSQKSPLQSQHLSSFNNIQSNGRTQINQHRKGPQDLQISAKISAQQQIENKFIIRSTMQQNSKHYREFQELRGNQKQKLYFCLKAQKQPLKQHQKSIIASLMSSQCQSNNSQESRQYQSNHQDPQRQNHQDPQRQNHQDPQRQNHQDPQRQNHQDHPRQNYQNPPRQNYQNPPRQEQRLSSKPSLSRQPEQQYSQTSDPNNSSLAVHLKKAHEQKQQLRDKKIIAERQKDQYKQRAQNMQRKVLQLKKDMEQINIEKLALISQLKTIKQSSNLTKNQLRDTNDRNEHIYSQIHQKHQMLSRQNRKAMAQNDFLQEQFQNVKTQMINLQKRLKFSDSKASNLQKQLNQLQQQHMIMIKRTVEEWKQRLQATQKQLRKWQNGDQIGGTNTSNMKIKLIQLQTQISHKTSLLTKRDEQIKNIKKQYAMKLQTLQEVLYQKERQIKQNRLEVPRMQRNLSQKTKQHQETIKSLQMALARLQKQLSIKDIETQDIKRASRYQDNFNLVQKLYPDAKNIRQASQAKDSLQGLVSTQTQQVNHYKKQLHRRIQQLFALRSQFEEQKSKGNNLNQQLKIIQMQYTSLQKKSSQSSSTQTYLIKNQLQISNRKLSQLQQKLSWKTKQIKEKDQFIQTQLLRLTKEQNVPKLLDALKQIGQRMNRS